MTTAIDVANYIIEKSSPLTVMKLQKLVYYSQAWSLVWDEKALFQETIRAWANGPVVRELYDAHKGLFEVKKPLKGGESSQLSEKQKETVDAVIKYYGKETAQWLSNLTHNESPWIQARKGLNIEERGSEEITLASMDEYYSSL